MNEPFDDIVITGAGLVTCLGLDRETTWWAVSEGRSGIGPLTAVESPLNPDKGGGQVNDGDDAAESATACPREVGFLRRAFAEAMRHAGIDTGLPCDADRCAVLLGTTLHGMRQGGRYLRSGDASFLRAFLAGATLNAAIADLPSIGMTATTCSACSSGLASVALGHTLLRTGEADLVIAGGYDPISEYAYAGFNSMRLVSDTTLRPFARSRDGMKVAEGYAIVVMERAADALARGASALATIAGFGESCDTHHLSKPHPEGAGAMRAMCQALASAGLDPPDIDLLIAHATATPNNDASEHAALVRVFGADLRQIPLVGLKSCLGHSLGAAGAVDLVLGALAIRDDRVPAPPDGAQHDIEFDDIRCGPDQRPRRPLRHVLTTSLGFGGANACMVITAPRTPMPVDLSPSATNPVAEQQSRKRDAGATGGLPARAGLRLPADAGRGSSHATGHEVLITGVGVVLPGVIGAEALAASLASTDVSSRKPQYGAIPVEQFEHLFNARRARRMAEFAKLCLAATADAYRDAGIEDAPLFGETCAAIVGTTNGATEYCNAYYRQLVDDGVDAANPTLFAEGVPNVASAHLSTNFAIQGFCQTMIGTRTAGLEALRIAAARIRAGDWTRAIVSAAEEYTDVVRTPYRQLLSEPTFDYSSGAVTFVLEASSSAEQRGARVRGEIAHAASRHVAGDSVREWIASIGDVAERLSGIETIATSGSATHVGRIERLGVRHYRRRLERATIASPTSPARWPEMFSVTPMALIAAALLAREPIAAALDRPARAAFATRPGASPTRPRRIGVLCTDFNRGTHGVAITIAGDRSN